LLDLSSLAAAPAQEHRKEGFLSALLDTWGAVGAPRADSGNAVGAAALLHTQHTQQAQQAQQAQQQARSSFLNACCLVSAEALSSQTAASLPPTHTLLITPNICSEIGKAALFRGQLGNQQV
jgi:hypothetical protein